jgi:hypothetical protein
MPAAVARQKINPAAVDFAAHDRIGRGPERSLDLMFLRIADSSDLVKAAPPDDADGRIF